MKKLSFLVGLAMMTVGVSCAQQPNAVDSIRLADGDGAQTQPKTEEAPQPPKVGDIALDFELSEVKGEKIGLAALAAKGPVILVVLRGFPGYQCPVCTVQVGQLLGKAEQFAKSKANVVLVYPGPADGVKARAEEFVRGKTLPTNFYLLLDPDFSMINRYGLRWNAKNETSYPSTFVLDRERKVLFAKVSRTHGDRAKVEDILAALP